ncbi:serine/threonine-protein kinase [Haliangium ochraceum]|uniref:non-specific serine/threonine protein kinase n=1 Tax=Haliangium ochraceum (strain DSM 14365 / JCM 11303 / SMP-2) TaxID=502025 RepID=D0LND3_HALO1|nr:serine/threonine-protein kinase [Haliangium ochraceum]ACY15310.1 serine/threonine protein kinase [Haliangium ochraceum DSM 14365]
MSIYELRHVLGRGGQATVFEAVRIFNESTRYPVACKRLRPDVRNDRAVWQRFIDEAFLGFDINNNHPNLVTVYDLVEDRDGNLCIIMELVQGCTLRDLIGLGVRIPEKLVRYIARELLSALAYIHARCVVHRDVSPCNVLLSRDGDVKLSDLGLAKLLTVAPGRSPNFLGKVAYASPEQLRAHTVDARTDLYALGCVIYEMLAGAPPFGEGKDPSPVLARMHQGPPPLQDGVSEDLRALVHGLLQSSPDSRLPASAEQGLTQLARDGHPIATRAELADMVISVGQRNLEEESTQPGNERAKLLGLDARILGGEQVKRERWPRWRNTMSIHSHRSFRRRMAALAALVACGCIAAAIAWKPWELRRVASAPQPAPTLAAADAPMCEPSAPATGPREALAVTDEANDVEAPAVEESAAEATETEATRTEEARVERRARKRATRKRREAASDEPTWAVVPKVERSPWHIYLKEDEK